MTAFYYDFHLHSALSPCADDDNTPNNLAGICKLSGIQIAALTDHNTCQNCSAFYEAALRYDLVPVAGMELTTAEDIHVVCLFQELADALSFQDYVNQHRILIPNRTEIFGNQWIMDASDQIIGTEKNLLIVATEISIDQVYQIVSDFHGVCWPAHIDKKSNSVLEILGAFPLEHSFAFYEMADPSKREELESRVSDLKMMKMIVSSDAHRLEQIRDAEAVVNLEIDAKEKDPEKIRAALFTYLRGQEI